MANYRRCFVPGGTYFFTVVTQDRAALFQSSSARQMLGSVMRRCFLKHSVSVIAIVLLPDHLHTLWSLPAGDERYSKRWSWIKGQFTRNWLALGGVEQTVTESRTRDEGRGVWQRRFWEHTIRDEGDLETHFDYIHFNPVKHGLVTHARDWPWSRFHRWVRQGHYPPNWGAGIADKLPSDLGE